MSPSSPAGGDPGPARFPRQHLDQAYECNILPLHMESSLYELYRLGFLQPLPPGVMGKDGLESVCILSIQWQERGDV
jgi:hypothetical protein